MLYFFLLYVKKKYILDRYEKEKKVIAYYVNNNERIMGQSNKALHEKYEFRNIRRDEIEQAVKIEAICFPPNEACTYEHMAPRIENAPDLFLVAVDRKTGKMAAFLNGLATNREHLTDDFFTQEFQVKLVNINLAAPFFIHMSTAFWMSVVTAMPYIFFEVWRFINPALYPNERKGVRKALTIGTGMFFIGVLMGYFMVYPLTLRFLSTYQLSATIENQISLNSYIDNFMMLVLCMGLAFELPLVTWLLSLLGLVHKTFLRKYRRHAVVIIVIVAAVITPTGDPFTLTVVAVPLYLLYEMSILMIKDKKADETEEIIETGER